MKKFIANIFNSFKREKYSIKKGYHHRTSVPFFDDRKNKDEWQNSVYLASKGIYDRHNYSSLIDIGCGSGYKLIKYFGEEDFIGVELASTLNFLKNRYPCKSWLEFEEVKEGSNFDLIILSDVIEHLQKPDDFLRLITTKINFKKIVISTPERDFVRGEKDFGPPVNTYHFREWNFYEFETFVKDYIDVESHFVVKEDKGTQIIIGTPI